MCGKTKRQTYWPGVFLKLDSIYSEYQIRGTISSKNWKFYSLCFHTLRLFEAGHPLDKFLVEQAKAKLLMRHALLHSKKSLGQS